MPKTDPLIRTKLHLPFTRSGLVSRPRLQEQLAQGLCGPLTLITAPAGFGKTTLVASCVTGSGMPVAWLSLDKDDNRAGRFLNYLVAALQSINAQLGEEAAQIMAAMQQAPQELVLTSIVNDLDTAGREMALVLDDYHLISSQAVHSAVAFLLEHCPGTFHLVIASRSDPALPLARLRARGQTLELRAADLSFTAPEAAQFLNDVMGLRLDDKSLAVLEERTEGWIAGLQMASIALQSHRSTPDRSDVFAFIAGFSGTNRYILDYLLEEILASQPPEIQRFLLCTSILERLTGPLCDALLAGDDGLNRQGSEQPAAVEASFLEASFIEASFLSPSATVLADLERANLFLVPLDDERQWYRYHHLFADLLRARLQQSQPDLVPFLHTRASAWLEQKGFITEAIQHRFAAQEMDQAASLIERYGPARWADSDPSVIQMADGLPREMLIAHPQIGIYQAWLLIIQGEIKRAMPLLHDMSQYLAGADPHSSQQWIQTIITLALAFLSPPGSIPLPDAQALDAIPAGERILRDAADVLYGMTLGRRGEMARAAEVALKCIKKEQVPSRAEPSSAAPSLTEPSSVLPHDALMIPTLVPFLARIYLMQGRLHATDALCHEYLDPVKEKGIRYLNSDGGINTTLGEVLYEWNRLDEAENQIRDGLRTNEPWQNIMTDGFGLTALIRVLLAKGKLTEALQATAEFETRMQRRSRPREFDEDFYTLRARLQLASGDLQKASLWADQVTHGEDFQRHPEYYQLTLAHIFLAQGRYATAERTVTRVVPDGSASNRIARQLEINMLLAAAWAAQQRLPEAFEMIESSLALAEQEGYVQVFLNAGEPVGDLLAAYLRSDAPGHQRYAQKLLDAFPLPGGTRSPVKQPAGLVEPLSERELEVLHLMALGKTNEEIARQLVVARGTIKAHAASIYRKLDAANRTEAVARARALGILT